MTIDLSIPHQVIQGDCLEVMRSLPAECVDAVVTDPPYGIGWKRGTWVDDPEAYPDMMRRLVAEFNRLSSSWVFVFQAMPNAPRFHEWFGTGWRIFAACKNFAQIRPTGVWHSWDPVVFWNSGPNSGPNSGHVNRDYHVGNVAGELGNPVGHPCPRPLDTMAHIVQIASPRGGIILDPFCGSGTTGVACVQTGRRFIGIEIEPKYVAIARRRISEAAPLFVRPKENEQMELPTQSCASRQPQNPLHSGISKGLAMRTRRNPPGLALLTIIAIIVGSAVIGGAGVAAYNNGTLAPPTPEQRQGVTGLGAIFAPFTGGASIPISDAFLFAWTALTGGTAIAAVRSKRKSDKATQALWNSIPNDSPIGNDLPPAVLATLHATDAKTDARIKAAS